MQGRGLVTPLPLATALFVLGLYVGSPGAPATAVRIAIVLACLVVARAAGPTRQSVAAPGSLLLVCALLLGIARASAMPPLAPRDARVQARPEATLLRGRVLDGCDEATPDGRGLRVRRCIVAREGNPARVALRIRAVDQGAEPDCHAREGDELEAVVTITARAPEVNGARGGPGAVSFARGVLFSAEGTRCDVRRGPRVYDLRAHWLRAGARLRAWLEHGLARALRGASCARARALLFGDEQGLERDELEAFRETGLSHLLAVSGAHVVLVSTALEWLVRRVLGLSASASLSRYAGPLRVLAPLPAVAVFVAATGAASSAVRALVSCLFAALATLAGRRAHPEALVALSAALTAFVEPGTTRDPGWQLSVCAAWALAVETPKAPTADLATPARSVAHTRGAPVLDRLRVLAARARVHLHEGLVTSVRVAVVVAPIVLWHFRRIPLVALAANVVAAPLTETLALPAVLASALVGALLPATAPALCAPLAWALDRVFALPSIARALPFASTEAPPPTVAQASIALAVSLLCLRFRWPTRFVGLGASLALVALLEGAHRRAMHPTGLLRVTALDVGQGDALLIDLPDGEAMLVDAGGALFAPRPSREVTGPPSVDMLDPGARIVVPVLADRRRRALAVVVASHPHPDHIGGLAAVLSWASVRELWDTRQGERPRYAIAAQQAMRRVARERSIVVRGPETLCGTARVFHGALLEVLGPCPAVRARDEPNDASFVLRISYGAASVLLPGDLEARGERALLARPGVIAPVTLLKLGHHGSRTSTSDPWLSALSPRVALVSCGHPSPFGHPHPSVLDRLAQRHIELVSTAREGLASITLFRDGSYRHDR